MVRPSLSSSQRSTSCYKSRWFKHVILIHSLCKLLDFPVWMFLIIIVLKHEKEVWNDMNHMYFHVFMVW